MSLQERLLIETVAANQAEIATLRLKVTAMEEWMREQMLYSGMMRSQLTSFTEDHLALKKSVVEFMEGLPKALNEEFALRVKALPIAIDAL